MDEVRKRWVESAGPPRSESHRLQTREARTATDTAELRILLIEDSELLRSRLSQMLTEPGKMRVVASAASESEARRKIEAAEYDVLLVDVELQEGSGIGAIRHARSVYPEPRRPLIIVLTNYPLPAVRNRCIDAGADYFLDKMRQFQEVKPLIAAARPLPRS